MIFDCHCHLDLYKDMKGIFTQISNSNISAITMTTTPRAWDRNYSYSRRYKNVFPALGLHPELIRERKKEIELFFKYLAQAKCVGEIGIDGSENNKNYIEEQKAIFMEIIQRCDSYKNKVISIHSRKAEAHVLDILESKITESSSNTYIMHWYTGDLRNLSRAVDLGCYFSINKKMADSKNGSVIIRKIPFTRLLLESDSPLISNISRVGELESDLLQCIKLIAKIKNLSQSEIVGRIEENQEYALKSLLQVLP